MDTTGITFFCLPLNTSYPIFNETVEGIFRITKRIFKEIKSVNNFGWLSPNGEFIYRKQLHAKTAKEIFKIYYQTEYQMFKQMWYDKKICDSHEYRYMNFEDYLSEKLLKKGWICVEKNNIVLCICIEQITPQQHSYLNIKDFKIRETQNWKKK